MEHAKIPQGRIDTTQRVQLDLSLGQVLSIMRLVRSAAMQKERRIAKSNFVPEPGKRDTAKYALEKLDNLLDDLFDATGIEELS